jgi:hypothetical protein
MATQKRFYVLLLNDPNGNRALGPFTKREARIAQIAHCGSRIVTATQLAQMRERGQGKQGETQIAAMLTTARQLAHNANDPMIFKGDPKEFFRRAANGGA